MDQLCHNKDITQASIFGCGQVIEMTNMTYSCQYLSQNLILVTWYAYPTEDDECRFLAEHRQQLDAAEEPLYYISDLRQGRVISGDTLEQMSDLTKHPNYGGGTAFSSDPISRIMVSSFRRMSLEATTRLGRKAAKVVSSSASVSGKPASPMIATSCGSLVIKTAAPNQWANAFGYCTIAP